MHRNNWKRNRVKKNERNNWKRNLHLQSLSKTHLQAQEKLNQPHIEINRL